ncbi:hypothetical protein SUGI_0492960 [Cryptomeria japonica]|nr:hypothetical protein SUGI_0492960 [Cryptomeria japonica]
MERFCSTPRMVAWFLISDTKLLREWLCYPYHDSRLMQREATMCSSMYIAPARHAGPSKSSYNQCREEEMGSNGFIFSCTANPFDIAIKHKSHGEAMGLSSPAQLIHLILLSSTNPTERFISIRCSSTIH